MDFTLYVDGLCGIADMWTASVDELAYIIFLNKVSAASNPRFQPSHPTLASNPRQLVWQCSHEPNLAWAAALPGLPCHLLM